MKGRIYVLALVLVLFAPLAALADICDDVNDIANGWNDMANGIHEMDLENLTQRDAEEIDAAIEEAFGATEEFADLLEEHGNAREVKLGRGLNRALKTLWDADGIDAIVDAMDGVVDALDTIVDFCDEQ